MLLRICFAVFCFARGAGVPYCEFVMQYDLALRETIWIMHQVWQSLNGQVQDLSQRLHEVE